MTRSNRRTRSLVAGVALIVAPIFGCGGAENAGAKPPSSAITPSSSLDKTTTNTSGGVGAQIPGSEKEPSADGTIDDIPHAQLQFEDSHQAFTAASGDCAQMCKALSSMQRAADHLCGLTKDGANSEKKRCDDAQSKVDGAKERVKATCGGCG